MRDIRHGIVHVGVTLVGNVSRQGIRGDDHRQLARAEHVLKVITGLGRRVRVGVALLVEINRKLDRFDVRVGIDRPVALVIDEAAAVAPCIVRERSLAFVRGHVDAPRIHIAAVEVNQRLAGVFQLGPSGRHFNAGRLKQIHVVVQRAGGSQIRHSPNGAVDHGLLDKAGEEIVVQLFRAIILNRHEQALVRVIREGVQVQDVRRIVVADAGGHHGVHIVPGDDFQIQLDAGVGLFKLLDEAGAVHARAGEPVVGLRAVLADDDVQRDVLGHADGCAGNQHSERQHQGRKLLHEISSSVGQTPFIEFIINDICFFVKICPKFFHLLFFLPLHCFIIICRYRSLLNIFNTSKLCGLKRGHWPLSF